MLPIIGLVLPALIHLAESVFSGKPGETKKEFVMKIVSDLLDKVNVPDVFKNADEKKMVLDIISVLIDNLVPELLK